jgi:predicted Fe-Mo cluster-binding NifX family protein
VKGVEILIIGIPTMGSKGLDENVGEHFGRTPTYTLFDTENEEVRVLDNTSEHMGGTGHPPALLAENGVEMLICQGLGRRAIAMFSDKNICVLIGARGTVSESLRMWRNGELVEANENNACGKHAFRSQHHHGSGHHHH